MTEEDQQMLNFYRSYNSDAYDFYKQLLEYYSKEQLALTIVQLVDENNVFKKAIKQALGKEEY